MGFRLNPSFFYRKKTYNYEQTNLSKVLGLIDLTALGNERVQILNEIKELTCIFFNLNHRR